MKKIAFMGSDPIAIPLLEYLYSNAKGDYQLVGIISQPDRPSGRGHKISPNPISAWALEKKILLFRPEKPSEIELTWVKDTAINLVLVMAYGHIIKKNFLNTPSLGMLNFHGSLLPAYRGASPVESAIASGDKITGISLMQMVAKMDAGDLLDQEAVSISKDETSASLRLKLADACVPLIGRNIATILEGKGLFTPQDESKMTYTRKINKEDGWLNFNASAKELDCRVRALSPWPGGFFKIGETIIKIGCCEPLDEDLKVTAGAIIGSDEKGLLIGTAQGVLRLTALQRPGGKMLPIHDFLRGFPLTPNMQIESGPMLPLVSHFPFF